MPNRPLRRTPRRTLPRTPSHTLSRARLGLAALVALVALTALLIATARLSLGDTVLLPGTERAGVREVSGEAGELSLAVDVRNGGPLPLRVEGPAVDRLGSYDVRLGRGVPGGGVPEQEQFAPFVLWPGQQRLLVLHLTRTAASPGRPLELRRFAVATSVFGVDRDLEVVLPATLRVS